MIQVSVYNVSNFFHHGKSGHIYICVDKNDTSKCTQYRWHLFHDGKSGQIYNCVDKNDTSKCIHNVSHIYFTMVNLFIYTTV